MTLLGHLTVDSPPAFDEARRKVLRLSRALGFGEVDSGRLASVFSGLTRPTTGREPGREPARAELSLTRGPRGAALAIRFDSVSRGGPEAAASYAPRFFDSFRPVDEGGRADSFLALKHLPDPEFHASRSFLREQRDMLERLSREELLLALEQKNAALESEMAERIRGAEELRRQRALLDTLVNALPLVIYSKDLEGRYQIANDSLCALVGRGREDIVGRTAFDIFPPEIAENIRAAEEKILSGVDMVTEEDWRTYPDGRKALFHMTRVPVTDERGHATGLVGAFLDVTGDFEARERIRVSENKYRELVESAKSVIIKLDLSGNITFFNEYAQQFFGFTTEEVLGRSIVGTIVPPTESGGRDLGELIADIVARPELYEKNENENVRKDGSRVWVSWTNQVALDESNGQPAGLLCVGLDATERKKAQDGLQDAMEVISGSIRYASRIQRAILPPERDFTAVFPRHFVVWNPRDVVGGDIYWTGRWGAGHLFVLGDCTGHGVPGAFMTLIATGALSRALGEVEPGRPALLMRRAHRIVQTSLNQHVEGGDSDDGMELGMCYLEPGADHMLFVGARFPLFVCEGGEILEIKADRKGIGYRGLPGEPDYAEHRVPLRPGLRLYLASDGVFDQIGGDKRRGFGKNRFKQLLLDLAETPFETHGERILEALGAYQGGEKRRDDVSIMGLEY